MNTKGIDKRTLGIGIKAIMRLIDARLLGVRIPDGALINAVETLRNSEYESYVRMGLVNSTGAPASIADEAALLRLRVQLAAISSIGEALIDDLTDLRRLDSLAAGYLEGSLAAVELKTQFRELMRVSRTALTIVSRDMPRALAFVTRDGEFLSPWDEIGLAIACLSTRERIRGYWTAALGS